MLSTIDGRICSGLATGGSSHVGRAPVVSPESTISARGNTIVQCGVELCLCLSFCTNIAGRQEAKSDGSTSMARNRREVPTKPLGRTPTLFLAPWHHMCHSALHPGIRAVGRVKHRVAGWPRAPAEHRISRAALFGVVAGQTTYGSADRNSDRTNCEPVRPSCRKAGSDNAFLHPLAPAVAIDLCTVNADRVGSAREPGYALDR